MKPYSDKTRYLFTQLRARGISLGAISTELDVPKSTLGDWDKLLATEIARLRAIEWEAIEEQFGRTLEQDLRAMAERIRKWEARIDRMNPDHFKVREVLAVLRETRREYFRRRAILMAPLVAPGVPPAGKSGVPPGSSCAQHQKPVTESNNVTTNMKTPAAIPPLGGGETDSSARRQTSAGQDAGPSSSLVIDSSLDIRHSSFSAPVPPAGQSGGSQIGHPPVALPNRLRIEVAPTSSYTSAT